jgi:hypothetical protein
MTSTLIGGLKEKGVLSFDDTLEKMSPELLEEMRPAYRKVTIRQLLSHTSGMPYGPSKKGPRKPTADPEQVRALSGLKTLVCAGSAAHPGRLADLSPLLAQPLAPDLAEEVLHLQEGSLPRQFELVAQGDRLAEVRRAEGVLAVLEPVPPRLADPLAARAVPVLVPGHLPELVQGRSAPAPRSARRPGCRPGGRRRGGAPPPCA